MQEFGLTDIIPLMCTLALRASIPLHPLLESSQGGYGAEGLMNSFLFVSILSSHRVTDKGSCSGLIAIISFDYRFKKKWLVAFLIHKLLLRAQFWDVQSYKISLIKSLVQTLHSLTTPNML